jgi:predicted Na+-dependent transporter
VQIVGLLLTGGGIYYVIDQVRFVEYVIGSSLIYNAAVIVTVASGLTIGVSFLGCCSSRSASNRWLTVCVSV